MNPEQIATLIMQCHLNKIPHILEIQGFRLDLQLNYTGRMATGGYNSWKKDKHKDRKKVGCFDFKVYELDAQKDKSLRHPKVITEAVENLNRQMIEQVFLGKDPFKISKNKKEKMVLQGIQLAMLEQEINWGDEIFQTWSHFPPSKGKRPRDFIMAYLRRIFEEPDIVEKSLKKRAASGTLNVLSRPKTKDWNDFLEPTNSHANPWINGDLLKKFRSASLSMPDNPYYAIKYAQNETTTAKKSSGTS